MKKTMFILAAVALGFSLPLHAKGNYEAGKAKSTTCAACHGADGVSAILPFPSWPGSIAIISIRR